LGGVDKSWHFATERATSMAPPGRAPHPHHNQQANALAGAETAGGSCGGYLFNRGKLSFFAFGGVMIEVAFHDQAGDFDGSARSHTSTTPQSTSDRVGGGGNGRGIAWRLCFERGFWFHVVVVFVKAELGGDSKN
jgi:hypothetical protein